MSNICRYCKGTGQRECSACHWKKSYARNHPTLPIPHGCNVCADTGLEACWQCRGKGIVRENMPDPLDAAVFNRMVPKNRDNQPVKANEIHGYTIVTSNCSPSDLKGISVEKHLRQWIIGMREKSRWEQD